jgi:hypothetical protein
MLIRAAEYVFTIETASFKPKSLKKLHGKNITISMFLTFIFKNLKTSLKATF